MRAIVSVAALLAVNLALSAVAAPIYRFAGVDYVFPATQGDADDLLSAADGAGTLEWAPDPGASSWPANMVVFSATGSCPAGWSEYTTARGRAIVALVAGGTDGGTVGTALSDAENRPVGQHTHSVADPGHTHAQVAHSHSVTDAGHVHAGSLTEATVSLQSGSDGGIASVRSGSASSTSATTGVTAVSATATNASATTGIAVSNAGSVAGTNAPYVQLIACESPTP